MKKILMLGIGSPSKSGKLNEVIQRHIDYSKAFGGIVFILFFDPKSKQQVAEYDHLLYTYNCNAKHVITYPFFAIRKAYFLYKTHKFDLIYTQDPFGTALVGRIISLLFNIPLIVGSHASFLNNPAWIKERPIFFSFLNILAKNNIKSADALKSVSFEEAVNYNRTLNVEFGKILIQNTPVKLQKFLNRFEEKQLNLFRKQLGINLSDIILIWVGRPVKQKRIPYMLELLEDIAKINSNIKLLIIGNFSLVQEISIVNKWLERDLIKNNVIWIKEGVENDLLPFYYQMADIYIHTASYEGLCKSIIEASASGLPIVTTNFSGLSQSIIQNKSGFIVQQNDKNSFIDYVLQLVNDKELRITMGAEGKKHIENNFNYEIGIKNITQFWQKTINVYQKKQKCAE